MVTWRHALHTHTVLGLVARLNSPESDFLVNFWKYLLQKIKPLIRVLTRLNLLHLFDLELYTLFLFIFEVDLLITHKREPLIYVASLLLLLGHEIL
jgi:hypothetical protein